MEEAQVLLCTIASTSRLLREWEEKCTAPLTIHTAIVDECGCTPESSTALLLKLNLTNLILVGDHKQVNRAQHFLKQPPEAPSYLSTQALGEGSGVRVRVLRGGSRLEYYRILYLHSVLITCACFEG